MSDEQATSEAQQWIRDWCWDIELVLEWAEDEEKDWASMPLLTQTLRSLGVDIDSYDRVDEVQRVLAGMVYDQKVTASASLVNAYDNDWEPRTLRLLVSGNGPTVWVVIDLQQPGRITVEHSDYGHGNYHNRQVADWYTETSGIDPTTATIIR